MMSDSFYQQEAGRDYSTISDERIKSAVVTAKHEVALECMDERSKAALERMQFLILKYLVIK